MNPLDVIMAILLILTVGISAIAVVGDLFPEL